MATINFDSRWNYQKIFGAGSFSVTATNAAPKQTTTITHSLGYQPNVRVWFTIGNGKIVPAAAYAYIFNNFPSDFYDYACWFRVYTDRVEIVYDKASTVSGNKTTTIYYRIYTDAT